MARPKNARDFFEVFRLPSDGKGKDDSSRRPDQESEEKKMVSSGPAEQRDQAQQPAQPAAPERAAQEAAPRAEPEETVQAPERDAAPAGRRASLGGAIAVESGNVVITLSRQAFAAAVVIILLFIALSFAAGNWRGSRSRGVEKNETKVASAAVERPVTVQPTPAPKKGRSTGFVRQEIAQAAANAPKPARERERESRTTTHPPAAPAGTPPGPPEPTVRTPYFALQVIGGINANKAEKLRAELEQEGYQNVVVKHEGKGATVFLGRFESKDSSEAKQYQKVIKERKFEGKLQFKDCYIVKVD